MASSTSPTTGSSPSASGPEDIVPESLKVAFSASKDAKLLTVHGIDGVGCSWLTARLLGDWLRNCTFDPATGKCDIGIVVCSYQHSLEYYIGHLQPFGIDLAWHVEQGHVKFLGSQFENIIADSKAAPSTLPHVTFDASLALLGDLAGEMRTTFDRTVLFLDNPEMGMALTTDDDDVRIERWLLAVDNATYNYDNAVVSMVVDFAQPLHSPVSRLTSDAATSAISTLNVNAQMAVTVRPNNGMIGSGRDGRVSIVYRMDYPEDLDNDSGERHEEDHNIQVGSGGRVDFVGETY
ncbi:60S ribosomal protein L37 [Sporothrix curviconia]|uniref:60S ribosomal protein L37 n=1 Tax=Sporothrix curviconia TaxID=1260050 RepID=A0ABP0C091_9PEZI